MILHLCLQVCEKSAEKDWVVAQGGGAIHLSGETVGSTTFRADFSSWSRNEAEEVVACEPEVESLVQK